MTVSAVYELECTDCDFETAVCGDLEAVLAAADAHRERQGAGPREHFVNLHRRE